MIRWTEEGKIWHFPIDNEQGSDRKWCCPFLSAQQSHVRTFFFILILSGLDEEAQFSFEQHVFLDQALESWCPKNGPVRIFMELVCNGLSKNPYLTVKQKHEHIEWYQNYFDEKKEVLERMVVQQKQQKLEQSQTPLID